MQNHPFRFIDPFVIVLLILVSGTIAEFITDNWDQPIPITVFVTGALLVMNKWGWKKPFISKAYSIPDLSGSYEGHLVSTYSPDAMSATSTHSHSKTIRQTGSSIYIDTKTNGRTISKSLTVDVQADNTGGITIYHTYQNHGDPTDANFCPHNGTEILHATRDEGGLWKLEGQYYTSRIPQTRGTISLKQVSKP